jgi:hypothetical protein
VDMTTAAEDVATAWPAEQAEEALRRIVTVLLHSKGSMGIREMAVLCLACDALGIDEPVLVTEPPGPRPLAVVPESTALLVG